MSLTFRYGPTIRGVNRRGLADGQHCDTCDSQVEARVVNGNAYIWCKCPWTDWRDLVPRDNSVEPKWARTLGRVQTDEVSVSPVDPRLLCYRGGRR